MKCKNVELLPIVIISLPDHGASLEGPTPHYRFAAFGVVLEETATDYHIGHWVCEHKVSSRKKLGEITSRVVKTKGLSIKTIGHYVITKRGRK